MHSQLVGGEAALPKRFDASFDNARRCAAPTGVQKTDGSRWMRNEDWNAIGDRNGEGQAAITGDVSVRGVDSEPTLPIRFVHNDFGAVHLSRRREAGTARSQLVAQLTPTLHDQARGLVG